MSQEHKRICDQCELEVKNQFTKDWLSLSKINKKTLDFCSLRCLTAFLDSYDFDEWFENDSE